MRISIAMATYNGERFLREQLDSLAAQSRLPDELVICDDGSSDGTVEIAKRFARSSPFEVRVHRNNENLGYARNFERAIGLCSGEIIFLSDQDDVWFPSKVERVMAVFTAAPVTQVVVNDQVLTDGALRTSGVTKLQNLRALGRNERGLVEGCCTALRRDWARRLFPFPPEAFDLVRTNDLSHDQWINELSIVLGVRCTVAEPLQFFRRTGQNATEWYVSEPRRTGFRDIIKNRLPAAPVHAWEMRVSVLKAYRHFLRGTEFMAGDQAAALRSIAHEISSFEQRVELTKLHATHRMVAIFRLWRSGGYQYFEGWLSAISDVMRR
jgi:glycosyltransferase involved in cell wall biosynthesis